MADTELTPLFIYCSRGARAELAESKCRSEMRGRNGSDELKDHHRKDS